MLGVLAYVEFESEIFDNFFRNLAFIYSEELHVLAAIELNFEHANWLFILLEVVSSSLWSALDLGVSSLWRLCSLISWFVSVASISWISLSWLRVLLLSRISWSTLSSRLSCLTLWKGLALALSSGRRLTEIVKLLGWLLKLRFSHWWKNLLWCNVLVLHRSHLRWLVILLLLLGWSNISYWLLHWNILLLRDHWRSLIHWLRNWLLNKLLDLLNRLLLNVSLLLRRRLGDHWLLRFSDHLWSLRRILQLGRSLIFIIILSNLFTNS